MSRRSCTTGARKRLEACDKAPSGAHCFANDKKSRKKKAPTKPSPEVHQAQQLTHLSTTSTSPKVRIAQQSTHLATTKVSLHPNKKLTSMPGNPRQSTVSPISMSSLSIQVLSSKHSTEGVASLVSGEKIQVVNFHHGHATQAL